MPKRATCRQCVPIPALIILALFTGCKPTPAIEEYEIAQPIASTAEAKSAPTKQRILGAIIGDGEKDWWFFKMRGDAEKIAAQKAGFDQLITSLKFKDTNGTEDSISWKLPEGWFKTEKGPIDFATIRTKDPEGEIKLSVTHLGGTLLDNVNRWRGQIGLDPLTEKKLEENLEKRTIDNRTVYIVDVVGLGLSKGPAMQRKGKLPDGHPEIEFPKTH